MLFPRRLLFALALVPLVFAGRTVRADNWPNFRGPNFDGSNQETGLPARFSKNERIRWKTGLSGIGSSTPIVWETSVFVTALGQGGDSVNAYKIDLSSGEIEWQREFSKAPKNDRRSDMAGPSPVTNGKIVIFPSGSGDLVAYNFNGEEQWRKNLQEEYGQFALKWTYSSSPVIYDGKLYLQVLQRNQSVDGIIPGRASFLIALDPVNGREVWRQVRTSEASGESLEAYSTPIPVNHKGKKEILVSGADCITAHDWSTGKEVWRWATWNRKGATDWRIIPSPVYGDDMIVVCAPKGDPVYTFFAGSRGLSNMDDLKWVSKIDAVSCDVPTPLFFGDYFYFLNGRKKILSCVEPFSGKVEWSHSFPARAKIEASPSGADGKIFVISHTGEIFVFRAGARYELLHSTVLGQDPDASNRSTIVPAQGSLLIRIGSILWCVN